MRTPDERWSRRGKALLLAFGFACGAAFTVLVVLRDRGTFRGYALPALTWIIAIPAAFFAAPRVIGERRQLQGRVRWSTIYMIFMLEILLVPILGLPWSVMLGRRDVAEARVYCDQLIRAIDESKTATGTYPESLALIERDAAPRPLLLQNNLHYERQGAGFELSFRPPMLLEDLYIYSSDTRTWRQD